MTKNNLFQKLRRQNQGQYRILGACLFLSILLVSAFAFLYFSPSMQKMLPEGGDTRKLAWLMFFVTVIGCTIFTLYGTNLFFKYKSREFGVFLALGEQKKQLALQLAKELAAIIVKYIILGILLAFPVSFVLWKMFQYLTGLTAIPYQFAVSGVTVGLLFGLFLVLCILLAEQKFIKRTNIMDILNEQRKTELVKEVGPNTGKIGILLIVTGLILGIIVPPVISKLFLFLLPSIWNLTYLISLAGLYLFMLSVVGHTKKGKHPEKYYKNIISTNLMRFTARQTTKNMLVITMLIFVIVVSAYWGIMYYNSSLQSENQASYTYSFHYPSVEEQLSYEEIEALASEYQLELTAYEKAVALELIVQFEQRDLDDSGKYFTIQSEKLASFLSASDFTRISGIPVTLSSGEYQTIVSHEYQRDIWIGPDCLSAVIHPVTGKILAPVYKGMVSFDNLTEASDPFTFILSDEDYQSFLPTLTAAQTEEMVFFNTTEGGQSFEFAVNLKDQYISHASALSDFLHYYDSHEEALARQSRNEYPYARPAGLLEHNPLLMGDWKYKPFIQPLLVVDTMQLVAVFILLSFYISVISLTAAGIMSYVRSVTIAMDNRTLFDNLRKLGADNTYVDWVIKSQLKKIFFYPLITGISIAILFTLFLVLFNDMRLQLFEIKMLGLELILSLVICAVFYGVYQLSLRKMNAVLN